MARPTRLFRSGWGDEELIAEMAQPGDAPPCDIDLRWDDARTEADGVRVLSGRFLSPLAALLPEESRTAHVELYLPARWSGNPALCIHLGDFGDEGGWRRRGLVRPLVERGVGGLILETAYHGRRRPAGQSGLELARVSDLALMARATLEEARALAAWMHPTGYRVLALAGMGLGGTLAALASTLLPFPVATAAYLAPHALAMPFVDGALAASCDWRRLGAALFGEDPRAQLRQVLAGFDVTQLQPPMHARAAVVVAAHEDAYVSPRSAATLAGHWSGAELRWLDGGHVGARLRHRPELQAAVVDAMGRLAEVAPDGERLSWQSLHGGGAALRARRQLGWASASDPTRRQKGKQFHRVAVTAAR
jgi:hypothetical protein